MDRTEADMVSEEVHDGVIASVYDPSQYEENRDSLLELARYARE